MNRIQNRIAAGVVQILRKWKAALFMAGGLLLASGAPAAATDKPLDDLIRYYSAKAAVEKEFGMTNDYRADTAMYSFLIAQKDRIGAAVGTEGQTLSINAANRLALRCYRSWNQANAKGAYMNKYIDLRTKHVYVKKADGTYDEFTRKGVFFKNVPADFTLLLTGEGIYPVSQNSFLLYSRKKHLPEQQFMILSAQASHPQGWSLETALVEPDLRQMLTDNTASAGMTIDSALIHGKMVDY